MDTPTWLWLIELNVNDSYSVIHFISQWDYGQCWHFVRMLETPPSASRVCFITRSKGCFFLLKGLGLMVTVNIELKALPSVRHIWYPPTTRSYKQEDRYNLPCLSILTSSFTEIRYKIKLTSNKKEKTQAWCPKKDTTLTLFYFCMREVQQREQIKSSIPTYTPLSERREERWNDVSNTLQWVRRGEQRMIATKVSKRRWEHAMMTVDSCKVLEVKS